MSITIRIPNRFSQLATALLLIAVGVIVGMAVSARGAVAVIEDAAYTAVTPCAVFDSRFGTGPFAGPYQGDKSGGLFTGTNKKTLRVTGSGLTNISGDTQGANDDCGIPAGVVAVHLNIVAINPLTTGNVVAVDEGGTPSGGIVNYSTLTPALNNSNAHNVPVSPAGEVDVYANCGSNCTLDTVHVRGVVLGYWTDDLAVRVANLEALLADVTRDNGGPNGSDRLLLTGMNLQLVDGTGDTECSHVNGGSSESCNGLGNLIIGYNEDQFSGADRTGAHSLVVGPRNEWTAYGNVVFGEFNDATNDLASVAGGRSNTAAAVGSSITGGSRSIIDTNGADASVTGGSDHFVNAPNSTVAGGIGNRALDGASAWDCESANTGSVLPGRHNATVIGGQDNVAEGCFSVVTGGEFNTASGDSAIVVGGYENTAGVVLGGAAACERDLGSGTLVLASWATILGGRGNEATGCGSAILGGFVNQTTGVHSAAVGGEDNTAGGEGSVAVGGGGAGVNANSAEGSLSVVVGGNGNAATNSTAVVVGGSANTASGSASVVSGGATRSATGTFDWVAGGLFETS